MGKRVDRATDIIRDVLLVAVLPLMIAVLLVAAIWIAWAGITGNFDKHTTTVTCEPGKP